MQIILLLLYLVSVCLFMSVCLYHFASPFICLSPVTVYLFMLVYLSVGLPFIAFLSICLSICLYQSASASTFASCKILKTVQNVGVNKVVCVRNGHMKHSLIFPLLKLTLSLLSGSLLVLFVLVFTYVNIFIRVFVLVIILLIIFAFFFLPHLRFIFSPSS